MRHPAKSTDCPDQLFQRSKGESQHSPSGFNFSGEGEQQHRGHKTRPADPAKGIELGQVFVPTHGLVQRHERKEEGS